MKISSILRLSLWSQALLSLPHPAKCDQQVLSPQPRLRNGTLEDADDITTILLSAFASMPSWEYLYQFRDEYPEEHRRCLRLGMKQTMSRPTAHTEVIEAPTGSNLSVIAVAIWQRDNPQEEISLHRRMGKQPSHSTDCRVSLTFQIAWCLHRDVNFTRAFDWEMKIIPAKRKLVDQYFGKEQLYLEWLATHPDYQGQGAGTRLARRGIAIGREAEVNVTLLAQPSAESYYLHVGFDEISNMSIESVDKDRVFRFPVMAYNFTRDSLGDT